MILRLAILLSIFLAVCHAEEPIFIDDAKIEQTFVERLSALLQKDKTLAMSEAESAIKKKKNDKVSISKTTATAYAENSECKAHPKRDVQMIFKDCIPSHR